MARFLRVVVVAPLFFAACVEPEPSVEWLPAYEPFDPTEATWRKTRPVLLVSDCQFFNVDTDPLPERNLSAQAMVATAIRSPQLNLFAHDVMRFILEDRSDDFDAIIHLGDAADLACEEEFLDFVEIMALAGKPWLMAPGNHDCFYFGNFYPARPDNWEAACRNAGVPLHKDRFVRLYVASLLRQEPECFQPLADDLGLGDQRGADFTELAESLPLQHRWEAPPGSRGFLDAIAWKIDVEHPWRSFVLQRANTGGLGEGDLPSVSVLLDSCQYWLRPEMMPNAWASYPLHLNTGMTGELLADQLRIVREWVEAVDPDQKVALLMSHHPLRTYAAKSSASLRWLWSENRSIAMFVTAHTHKGHYEHHFLEGGRETIELNIGSTTDWPIEWRSLQIFYRTEPTLEAYVQSDRYLLADELRNDGGYFMPGWEIAEGEPDDYRAFRQGTSSIGAIMDIYLGYHLKPPCFGQARIRPKPGSYETEVRYKNTLLGTYYRLVTLFPTDVGDGAAEWPGSCGSDQEVLDRVTELTADEVSIDDKIDFLDELHHFEDTRTTRDPVSGEATDALRKHYKLSQAVWASRYGLTRGRKLDVGDELIRVGKPASSGGE